MHLSPRRDLKKRPLPVSRPTVSDSDPAHQFLPRDFISTNRVDFKDITDLYEQDYSPHMLIICCVCVFSPYGLLDDIPKPRFEACNNAGSGL